MHHAPTHNNLVINSHALQADLYKILVFDDISGSTIMYHPKGVMKGNDTKERPINQLLRIALPPGPIPLSLQMSGFFTKRLASITEATDSIETRIGTDYISGGVHGSNLGINAALLHPHLLSMLLPYRQKIVAVTMVRDAMVCESH